MEREEEEMKMKGEEKRSYASVRSIYKEELRNLIPSLCPNDVK
jgi:hypothetical protein